MFTLVLISAIWISYTLKFITSTSDPSVSDEFHFDREHSSSYTDEKSETDLAVVGLGLLVSSHSRLPPYMT